MPTHPTGVVVLALLGVGTDGCCTCTMYIFSLDLLNGHRYWSYHQRSVAVQCATDQV
jgi:hypothetical protein